MDRVKKVQDMLAQKAVDALLIEDEVNLYYMTGLSLSASKLLVTHQEAMLFVDARYLELCQKRSPFPVQLLDPSKLDQIFQGVFASIRTLAFASDKLSYHGYMQLKKQLDALPHPIQLVPLQNPLQAIRLYKDQEEIEKLKSASNLGSAGFDFLCSILHEGISEEEAASELEIFWKKSGASSAAFDPIIAFGANSSMPHYRAGQARLEKGQIILIDIGVTLNHYHSDMTRVAFFEAADALLLSIHSIAQNAQEAALEKCRPGTPLGALDTAAREVIDKAGYGKHFTDSLGHGIGLEVHEYPTIKNADPLKK